MLKRSVCTRSAQFEQRDIVRPAIAPSPPQHTADRLGWLPSIARLLPAARLELLNDDASFAQATVDRE
jgi:hypothetical protein